MQSGPAVNGTSRVIGADGDAKMVTDNSTHRVLSANDQLDKSAVNDADDIIESSSPLRRDVNDDDDADMLAVTAAATTTCDSVIPPALVSLPSLMYLARQALDSRAQRSASTSADELFMKSPFPCCVTSRAPVEMFSEDEDQSDSMAEITPQVLCTDGI